MCPVAGPGFLTLPDRASKPRDCGFTHVLDKGLPVATLESLVATAGAHIDFVKLGWGTAYVSEGVQEKIAVCRAAGIGVSLGGTLLEIAVHQNAVDECAHWMHALGLEYVEVSNGALDMSTVDKQDLIKRLAGEFQVISEVGSKKPSELMITMEWAKEMLDDLDAGASLVIAEGRESGNVGLFGSTGDVHGDLVESIVDIVPVDKVIFEAPKKDQQTWFIERLGADVNLGNIPPDEVIPLETLRLGLRADTTDTLPHPAGGRRKEP